MIPLVSRVLLWRYARLFFVLMIGLGWLIVVVELPRHLAKDEPFAIIFWDVVRRASETLSLTAGVVGALALTGVILGARKKGLFNSLFAAGQKGKRATSVFIIGAACITMSGNFCTDIMQHVAERFIQVKPSGTWFSDGSGNFEWRTNVEYLQEMAAKRGQHLNESEIPMAAWHLSQQGSDVWRQQLSTKAWEPMWPSAKETPPQLHLKPVLPTRSSLFDPWGWDRSAVLQALGVTVRLLIAGFTVIVAGYVSILLNAGLAWLGFVFGPLAYIAIAGFGIRALVAMWAHGNVVMALCIITVAIAALITCETRLSKRGIRNA